MIENPDPSTPEPNQSMYVPQLEHDACGIGFIAHLKGKASHDIVTDALKMLTNMEHRGACGSDPDTGDGAGILIQVPDLFLREECAKSSMKLPPFGEYGVGMVFFPLEEKKREACRHVINEYIDKLGLSLLGYRKVPTNDPGIGLTAKNVEPISRQIFIKSRKKIPPESLERKLFVLRRAAAIQIYKLMPEIAEEFYFTSISYKTIVYKGQFRTDQLAPYFPDLQDPRVKSALALIHSRFSTNTFPKWRLAQPFRYIAHNGEINTIRGNTNWMRAKEALFQSPYFTHEEIEMILPVCNPDHSDSRNLDSIVEFLVMGGRSLPHVMMMLIPEAWQENDLMDETRKAFYEYHASLMEPWDGPASVCFTDGKLVGATLDRNGLRPSRYLLTKDDRVIMASETGALRIDPAQVIKRGRLQPGRIFIADLEKGRIISDEELKADICARQPYRQWLDMYEVQLEDLPKASVEIPSPSAEELLQYQQLFGVTTEEQKMILTPMAIQAKEPLGSMGSDTPIAILSHQSQHISHYFKQLFAQVSNPPIDSIRERLVMSLFTWIGGAQNVLAELPTACRHIAVKHPVLTNEELAKLRYIDHPNYTSITLDAVFSLDEKLEDAIDRLCEEAHKALAAEEVSSVLLILSDRKADSKHAPIPMLMAVGAIHHYLIDTNIRQKAALIAETADVREVHHYATIIGYGACAINPYLAFDSLTAMLGSPMLPENMDQATAHRNYVSSIKKGMLKVFSKMGISTVQSYHAAQIFEILGINSEVVHKCFRGSISRIQGMGFEGLAKEVLLRHQLAYPQVPLAKRRLELGGVYQWKRKGEYHLFNPRTIYLLQKSSQRNDYQLYKEFAKHINEQLVKACTLRSLLELKTDEAQSIPLEEVEPVANILKRFATGAMSFGSISHEAHTSIAIAMNRMGAKSNSGEGGEDERRFERKANGDWERSATKQVASGRFGVTSYYLANARELQIKMAQGAKPGEGGQLPGHKVDAWIGRVRHSTPGVGLISPPPHHDIYSIEDLAQLIFDLKNANRAADISVKLVSEAGVGTIASGVAKAHADHILISGHDGGTGASPLSSIRHAGLPWELGLAEAHQTLVMNKLRSRVKLQVDGQIRTGRDMAIATLLGAEEWGVATAVLVVEGCIMMRKCHLNTCPVGIATQDPELRKLFSGKPEHIVNYFTFMAEDLREIMASLGFRTVNEMVGQANRLRLRENIEHWKAKGIDLSQLLYTAPENEETGLYCQIKQVHEIEKVLDWKLLAAAKDALSAARSPLFKEFEIYNTDRAVGTLLSNEISKKYKAEGLPEGSLHFKFRGSAGQSFGAFGAKGLRLELEGDANDYFGKGLSGAQLIVYPDKTSPYEPSKNIIIGNVAFYGATSGEAFVRGLAGERFCVRNSGVKAVVEGVGDHACEYMTGGIAVILGKTGRNFAAGMSGGIAYVYDEDKQFYLRCNRALVDFDPLEEEDVDTLKELIEKHYAFTASRIALRIMTDLDAARKHFIKVMPRDYKSVLQQAKISNSYVPVSKMTG